MAIESPELQIGDVLRTVLERHNVYQTDLAIWLGTSERAPMRYDGQRVYTANRIRDGHVTGKPRFRCAYCSYELLSVVAIGAASASLSL